MRCAPRKAASERAARTPRCPISARGRRATRELRAWLVAPAAQIDTDAAFEIDFRLAQTERKFEKALVTAQGLRVEALADDGIVVAGQKVKLTLIVANRGGAPVSITETSAKGFADGLSSCPSGPLAPAAVARCEGSLTVPASARVSEPYWHRAGEAGRYTFDEDAPFGLPFRPTPFVAEARAQCR